MRTLAFAAVVALLALPNAQALVLEGSSASPSQADGAWQAAGLDWVLIVVPPEGQLDIHLAAPAATGMVDHTVVWARSQPAALVNDEVPAGDRDVPWEGPLEVNLTLGNGRWSSLLLQGPGALALELAAAQGEALVPLPQAKPFDAKADLRRGVTRPFDLPLDQVLVRGLPLAGSRLVGLELPASLVSRVEWHNATATCGSGACPDGAQTIDLGNPAMAMQEMHFLDVAFAPDAGALVSGAGSMAAAAAGAPAVTLRFDGDLRLPEVALSTCDPAPCPATQDHTLAVRGLVGNASLGAAGDGRRLAFRLEGDSEEVLADELPLAAFAREAAPAAAAAVGLALALKLALVLSAHRREDPLDNPRRAALYQRILANPGIGFRELMRDANVANGSLNHHLRVLRRHGLIADQSGGGRRRLFENHGRFDKTWRIVSALRDPAARELVRWLSAHPASDQKSILTYARERGWTRSSTQHRLYRLAAEGAIQQRREGRTRRYETVPEAAQLDLTLPPIADAGPASITDASIARP